MHWDDDDWYGSHRLRAQIQPIANGEANITVLPHAFTYFMAEDTLMAVDPRKPCVRDCEPGLTARASWGPHFGTLAWRRDIHARGGVRFTNTSEADGSTAKACSIIDPTCESCQ